MTYQLKRYISIFDKNNESHIGNLQFTSNVSTETLRDIFGIKDPDNNLYDEYPIDETMVKKINPLITEDLDLTQNYYFLSCDKLR